MNWGYKLTIVFIAFAALMCTMVYKCMKSPVSLVSADYYKDELKYQQVIDGSARASALSSQVDITVNENGVALQLPKEMEQQHATGNVWFYCVNNGNYDRRALLNANEKGQQQFALSMFSAGRYKVKVDWEAAGVNYYSEKEVIIP